MSISSVYIRIKWNPFLTPPYAIFACQRTYPWSRRRRRGGSTLTLISILSCISRTRWKRECWFLWQVKWMALVCGGGWRQQRIQRDFTSIVSVWHWLADLSLTTWFNTDPKRRPVWPTIDIRVHSTVFSIILSLVSEVVGTNGLHYTLNCRTGIPLPSLCPLLSTVFLPEASSVFAQCPGITFFSRFPILHWVTGINSCPSP